MKKWFRSETDIRVGGVCGGIAELFNWDAAVIRIICFALLFTPFPIIISYFAAWLILPKKGDVNVETSCTCGCHANSATTKKSSSTRTASKKEFIAG